jgi:tetratricopeptide (TPR) repeat protein
LSKIIMHDVIIQSSTDAWGQEITHGRTASVEPWNGALRALLAFHNDCLTSADEAAASDPQLVMAQVMAATLRLLSGVSPRDPSVSRMVAAASALVPYVTPRERRHVAALQAAAGGEFGEAGRIWDAILADHSGDAFALKMSHEALFLVGDVEAMLASAERAARCWPADAPNLGTAIGQRAFALEENGRYQEAELDARLGLRFDPNDVWSAHALAHVHEMLDRHADSIALLRGEQARWAEQTLSGHMWWHLALRHIAAGDHTAALALYDHELVRAGECDWFRLTDSTSLLWRLDLLGMPVGDRWATLAAKWRTYGCIHTSPFLDIHAAMAFSAGGDELEGRFLANFDQTPFPPESETANTLREVAKPLCQGIAAFRRDDWLEAQAQIELAIPNLHRIGGSLAQRQTVHRTLVAAQIAAGMLERARGLLKYELSQRPASSWALTLAALVADRGGRADEAKIYRRRLDAALA